MRLYFQKKNHFNDDSGLDINPVAWGKRSHACFLERWIIPASSHFQNNAIRIPMPSGHFAAMLITWGTFERPFQNCYKNHHIKSPKEFKQVLLNKCFRIPSTGAPQKRKIKKKRRGKSLPSMKNASRKR